MVESSIKRSDTKGIRYPELKVWKKIAFILRNCKFDKLREHVEKLNEQETHGNKKKLPPDLDQEHQNKEETYMQQGLTALGYSTSIVNMSNVRDQRTPFQIIEQDIMQRIVSEARSGTRDGVVIYDNLIVLIYVTGHGYSFEGMACRQHILLNDKLSFSGPKTSDVRYTNPYPIEDQLRRIFENFWNVSIELVVDACREKLEYHHNFKGLEGIPEPANHFSIRRDETVKPKNPANNFYCRNFACQHKNLTDGKSDYSRCYIAFINDRIADGDYQVPTMFSQFHYTNELSKSPNDYRVDWRDQLPGNQQVIHFKGGPILPKLEQPTPEITQKQAPSISEEEYKKAVELFKQRVEKAQVSHQRMIAIIPKEYMEKFVTETLTYDLFNSSEEITILPIFMGDSFIGSSENLAVVVFDGYDQRDDEELKQEYSLVRIDAHSDEKRLAGEINRQFGDQQIVGGYFQNDKFMLMVSNAKPKVKAQYHVSLTSLENHKANLYRCKPAVFAQIRGKDLILAVLDERKSASQPVGFFALKDLRQFKYASNFVTRYQQLKADVKTCSQAFSADLTDKAAAAFEALLNEPYHLELFGSQHMRHEENIIAGFIPDVAADLDLTRVVTFKPAQ